MKRLLLFAAILFLSTVVFAQNKGHVSGTITAAGESSFSAATVQLLKAADSSLVKMVMSNNAGKFEFEQVQEGKYFLLVTATGYTKYYSPVFEIKGTQPVVLKSIELTAVSKDMAAVTVVGRKPLIEQKIDRMVINVDAAVSNAGATALEVLEKSPGITVDKDGNISLKGKQAVQIFIDGRPSYLGGADLVNLLKNMNANQLDQIEIMTNPPAKYDAAGNSGIINIKLKKNKARGFNGSATAGYSQGFYWRTNESVNMNYRNGKFNAFMNYSYNKNNGYNELTIHRTYKKPDGKIDAMFDQVAFMPRNSSSSNLKVGMDFFASKNTTLGFVASGFMNPETNKNFNTSYLKNSDGAVDSIVYSTGNDNNKWKNGSLNLNFRHQYDSTGRELTADVDYSKYISHNHQVFTNASYFPNWRPKGETKLVSDLPVDINIYSAKLDYSHPLKKDARFEAGVKSSYVKTDNAANYFNVIGSDLVADYGKTNHFKYTENINAAYVNFNKQFKKFGIQAGLRFENTTYKGHQLGNPQKPDSSFSRTYNNLFPTVFVSYSADKNNQFGLSVGRRIDRPSYQDLNPFLFFLDNYTYEAGNTFLRPQYTNNLELNHTFKSFLTTTLNYSRTENYFTETFEQSGYATIVRNGNIGVRQNAGLSISAQITVVKWWTTVLYSNYNYTHYRGELYGELVNISASNILFNVNNQFKFEKGWSAELSGFYRTKGVDGQILIQPMGQASAGVSKQVMKGKGSVRLNIRDIFWTNRAKGTINFQKTEAQFRNSRDTRVAGISFTYRFGKPIKGPQNNRKKGGADEEQNRVKIGG
jgi:iron complex outermembrane recepter protein